MQTPDPTGSHLMEIYALQIQCFSKTRNNMKLKELYAKATSVQNNVPHPRTLAIIYECGGKMYMGERSFEKVRRGRIMGSGRFQSPRILLTNPNPNQPNTHPTPHRLRMPYTSPSRG